MQTRHDGNTMLVPTPPSAPVPVSTQSSRALPGSLLAIALVLSLWVAIGSVVHALADGAGPEPARRVLVGTVILLASAGSVLWRARLAEQLQRRPWLVLPGAAAQVLLAGVDGFVDGPYVAWSLTSLGMAVVAARPRTVWWCVALLVAVYSGGVLIEHSPDHVVEQGHLGGVVGAVISYPVAAGLLMWLRGRYLRFVADSEATLYDIRRDHSAFTAALAAAVHRRAPALGPPPRSRLTPSEAHVVAGLADGLAPKEIAHAAGVSITTVRTHLAHAKRKTGAKTLRELASLAADPRWPEVCR